MLGRYWKNSWGSPATPVARSDSTSNVLPLRWEASTKYDDGLSVTTADYLGENPLQPVDLHSR